MNQSNQIRKPPCTAVSSQDDGMRATRTRSRIKSYFARIRGRSPFPQPRFYMDDGFRRKPFQRPAFQQMISDMENGEIGIIVTKDLSRLGRNQLHTGLYRNASCSASATLPSMTMWTPAAAEQRPHAVQNLFNRSGLFGTPAGRSARLLKANGGANGWGPEHLTATERTRHKKLIG